jgi:hypothetical protein
VRVLMPFLALSPCECKRPPGSRAVPRSLTLYPACTPCTASLSHAAWDIDVRVTDDDAGEAMVVQQLDGREC